ncbi:berberine bridge enzyme-like 21 [Salvia splendens]|uniref:berberine bridge enzyme-like 21 n=1 Tax=Salvia splendens TaxID=180675 RepID=UPI001C26A02E|nr:berberine bridge enzyme-like 21 [Salvia splendens]
MFNLRSIQIYLTNQTAPTVWVQSGATLGELYYKIWEKSENLAFPACVCPTLGIGGHISCAGYGNLLRKYGLSIDNVVDAKVVDASGRILDREAMGEDLFWAINGGGAASFAVVLSYKINLVTIPNPVTKTKTRQKSSTVVGPGVEEKRLQIVRDLYDYMAAFVSNNPRKAYLNCRDVEIGSKSEGNSVDAYNEAKIYGEKYFGDNFD